MIVIQYTFCWIRQIFPHSLLSIYQNQDNLQFSVALQGLELRAIVHLVIEPWVQPSKIYFFM